MKVLDEVNFACGILVDPQKAFDTVDHSTLLKTLDYYRVKIISNKLLKSYLTEWKQSASINGFN